VLTLFFSVKKLPVKSLMFILLLLCCTQASLADLPKNGPEWHELREYGLPSLPHLSVGFNELLKVCSTHTAASKQYSLSYHVSDWVDILQFLTCLYFGFWKTTIVNFQIIVHSINNENLACRDIGYVCYNFFVWFLYSDLDCRSLWVSSAHLVFTSLSLLSKYFFSRFDHIVIIESLSSQPCTRYFDLIFTSVLYSVVYCTFKLFLIFIYFF